MTAQKASFEQVHTAMLMYRVQKSAYDFQALIKICEEMGWTMEEFNDQMQERLTFLKLQGKL